MKSKRLLTRLLLSVAALLFWVAVWWLIAVHVGIPLLLPTPLSVAKRLIALIATAKFWETTVLSLARILLGLLLSVLLGIVLAILTAKLTAARILLRPLMTAIRATPVAAFIILIWLWIGKDEVPTIITVLIALPVIYKNVETGILGIPESLLEMAKTFRIPRWKRLLKLDIPAVLPSFHAALQTAIGLGWKAGVAAEIIVRPTLAIGRAISDANYNLETEDLFAWTLTVILLSLLIETLSSLLLSRLFRSVLPTDGGKEAHV
jgi:NitT/TauT family transport system permease protein